MPKASLFRLAGCSIIVLLLGVLARAEDSLFDPTAARMLGLEERASFGPKSAGRSYDERMIRAAHLAKEHAQPRMTWFCWRYVKDALVEAGVVDSRPKTAYAKQAGADLCRNYGFVKLPSRDPASAPVGAVIVYGGRDAGHVELRTESGYASDFVSRTPYPRPCLGVFVKRG